MDFTNHPLNNKSIIDNRQVTKPSQSIIDYQTEFLRTKLGDPTLGAGLVALGLSKLGEHKLVELSEYVLRKSNNPGRAFVSLCNKLIKERARQNQSVCAIIEMSCP